MKCLFHLWGMSLKVELLVKGDRKGPRAPKYDLSSLPKCPGKKTDVGDNICNLK